MTLAYFIFHVILVSSILMMLGQWYQNIFGTVPTTVSRPLSLESLTDSYWFDKFTLDRVRHQDKPIRPVRMGEVTTAITCLYRAICRAVNAALHPEMTIEVVKKVLKPDFSEAGKMVASLID